MIDRSFTGTDLREMLEAATGYRPDDVPGRWTIETRHAQARWEVIVEPDEQLRMLIVVTAYAVG